LSDYKVALDAYSGPLDLLLFLIRREEVDIYDIPIAEITAQYLKYVDLLKTLDPDGVGEFLVLAATLMEIKSRMLLPRAPLEEPEEEEGDPRLILVRQLLEYKKIKDAARSLEEAAEERALRHERRPVLPPDSEDEFELENLEIWDLFDAFQRLLTQIGRAELVHKVGIDDTPLALHAADIVDSLQRSGGRQPFEEIFAGRSKAEMIGLFLALLELIRQRRVGAVQEHPGATILLFLRQPPEAEDEGIAGVEDETGGNQERTMAPTLEPSPVPGEGGAWAEDHARRKEVGGASSPDENEAADVEVGPLSHDDSFSSEHADETQ